MAVWIVYSILLIHQSIAIWWLTYRHGAVRATPGKSLTVWQCLTCPMANSFKPDIVKGMRTWRACFQNLLHSPRHVTHLHYHQRLPFAIKIVPSLIKYVPTVGYSHLTYCTMFTKWLKVGRSDMQEWTEEVLEPNKILFLCFSLCVFKIYGRVRNQFLIFWYLLF